VIACSGRVARLLPIAGTRVARAACIAMIVEATIGSSRRERMGDSIGPFAEDRMGDVR